MAFNPLKIFKKKDEDIVIDLGRLHKSPEEITSMSSTQETGADLGFLGNLASASKSTSVIEPAKSNINPERFERFGRRIDRLLERLELLERKIERIEHRLDIG